MSELLDPAGEISGGASGAAPGALSVDALTKRLGLPKTLFWDADKTALSIINQTKLPETLEILTLTCYQEVIDAIKVLAVRGAPAIGVAGAYALCVWSENQQNFAPENTAGYLAQLDQVAHEVAHARPTAVNLEICVNKAVAALKKYATEHTAATTTANNSQLTVPKLQEQLLSIVQQMEEHDILDNLNIGTNGAALIQDGFGVLTHCNAGSLATVYLGTALSALYVAHAQGKRIHVYADETRPLAQGARLTAWELMQAGIDVTLQCDDMAASLMAQGKIDCVIVGADRIAQNGDAANKIGTLNLAILANYYDIPFYVAAPKTTFDVSCACGADIPIEYRAPEEVTHWYYSEVPASLNVYNPAFDVTPAHLIDAIITNEGIYYKQDQPPYYQFS